MLHLFEMKMKGERNPNAFQNNQAMGDINHFHSFPLAPDSSIGSLCYYSLFHMEPLHGRPWHLEPTALPLQNTKRGAKRKGKNKKGCHARLLGSWWMGSIGPMHKMDIFGPSACSCISWLGLIEPAVHRIVHVPVSMGTHAIRCYGGRVDQWGRRPNSHRRRGE